MKQKCSRADHCPYLGMCIFILLLINSVAFLQHFLFVIKGMKKGAKPNPQYWGGEAGLQL